nr:Lrp/AsnC family transcriptional regulator [Nocardia sp. BMG111209]
MTRRENDTATPIDDGSRHEPDQGRSRHDPDDRCARDADPARPRHDLDEVDVQLLDALHANPRASFERLGPVLGISPVTAARRWQRLADSGRAWISSVPGPRLALVAAVVDVRTQPGSLAATAAALAAIPQVISVYATDGEFDLHTLVIAADMPALSALLLDRLPALPGVARIRSHTGLAWHSGVRWQLGAMDPDQQRAVAGDAPEDPRAARTRLFDPDDRALFLALQHDGRARYRELARTLDTSEHLIRRRVDTLVRQGMLGFRTDFARGEGGWPTEFVLWLAAPHHRLTEIGTAIGGRPQTRICLSAVGTANLMVMAQVHRPTDIGAVLDLIRTIDADTTVAEQRLILRAVKSWGRLLDPEGRAIGLVPVDPWAK